MDNTILTISFMDLLIILIAGIFFRAASSMQKMLFGADYSTIYDVVVYRNTENFAKTYAFRLLLLIMICMLIDWITPDYRNLQRLVVGIGLGSFLQVWPAIVNYHLLRLPLRREKLAYLLGCISYIAVCVAAVWITFHLLFPLLREEKEVYLLNNSGVQIVMTLISYSFLGGFELLFSKEKRTRRYISIEGFEEEKKILQVQMEIESFYVDLYSNEIKKYSIQNGISERMLRGILILEFIHRGAFIIRTFESVVCKCMPMLAIKHDFTVGLGQIKISTAKNVLQESPLKFIHKLCETDFNIQVCARYIAKLSQEFMEQEIAEDYYRYIACEYLGYDFYTEEKTAELYAAALRALDSAEPR